LGDKIIIGGKQKMNIFLNKNNFIKTIVTTLLIATLLSFPIAVAAPTQITTPTTSDPRSQIQQFGDIILEEGFEDGTMPPEGWTLDIGEPDVTWQITDTQAYSGTYSAYCPMADPPYDQNEWLITPEIDLSVAQDINLEFWAKTLAFAADWTVYLKARNVGESWTILWDCVEEEQWDPTEWHNKTINLDQYTGNTIQLAWQFVGIDSRDFYLDQITLYAGEVPPPAELEFSVKRFGIGKISAELSNVATDENAVAENVNWTFTATGNGIIQKLNFSATNIIPEIQPGNSAPIELPVSGVSLLAASVSARANDPRVNQINESFNAFVFLFFVFVLS
jgi:hypothetical protein